MSCLADEAPRPIDDRPVVVSADRVAYYSDLNDVIARGSVTVALPDGARVSGDAFVMDLSQHRLVIAGHVILRSDAGTFAGAALADFLAFGRSYFIPLDPSADRWTFADGDYAHPLKGREMPGDAFALADPGTAHPYIAGRRAVIDPNAFVRFEPASVNVLDLIPTPPLPAFVDNFSSDPNFGQNSLPGATVDAPYNFYGTAHSLDAIHLRYDQSLPVKTYGAFEHHAVFGDAGYAVFSLVPATQPRKQWNLVSYQGIGARDALSLDAQLFTTQSGLAAPSAASGFADLRLLHALPQSSLLVDVTQAYDTLLSSGTPNHPVIAGLSWSGDGQKIAHSGVELRLESGTAFAHDVFGVSGSGRPDVTAQHIGATLATPVYPGPWQTGINASFIARRTWLDFPNRVDSSLFTAGIAKRIADRLFATASYAVGTLSARNTKGVLVSPNVTTGLAPEPLSPNGLPVFGVPTLYRHTASHALTMTASWQPSPEFQFTLSATHTVYAPVQLPPPDLVTGAVRMRLTKALYASVGRSYAFGFQGQRWSPQFTLQVTGQ